MRQPKESPKTKFKAVLVKPIDQQHDRDESLIDPAGVEFSESEVFPIWRDFNYNVPDDIVGWGKVSRDDDGSLIVTGELMIDINREVKEGRFPYCLAAGVVYDRERNGSPVVPNSRLVSIGFTAEHTDPDQPRINILREQL